MMVRSPNFGLVSKVVHIGSGYMPLTVSFIL
jgi:hypothetical protein